MKYRKKPVIVEAIQFEGLSNVHEVKCFCGSALVSEIYGTKNPIGRELYFIRINTLEGDMYAYPGDYIIRGVKGEIYPCKPDIFEQTYISVDQETERACKGYETGAELEAYDDGYFDGFVDGTNESRRLLLEIIDSVSDDWLEDNCDWDWHGEMKKRVWFAWL